MADEIPDFDLYAELEVSQRASVETIQAAFRSLQLRNHPDRVGAASGLRAVRLNIARDWLTDPDRRSRYDSAVAARGRAFASADATAAAQAAADDWAGGEAHRTDVADDRDGVEADADDGPDADLDTEGPRLDGAPADKTADGRLRATHILLRLDLGRLVRIWLVGLAFLGGLAMAAGLTSPAAARVAIAVAALLVLLALTTRRIRTARDAGLITRAKRTGWSTLGWLGLALLAVDGVSAIALSAGRSGAGSAGGAGLGAAILPVLAATAAVSLAALRRRAGPVRASVDDFLAMTPTQFETAVGQVLGRHGYRLRPTGGPGDLVADLVGTDVSGKSTVVQCKRYAPGHPVGSRDVQLLIAMGMRHHGAERLVLVTTSDFTDPAIDLAEAHDVRLIAGDELEDLTR